MARILRTIGDHQTVQLGAKITLDGVKGVVAQILSGKELVFVERPELTGRARVVRIDDPTDIGLEWVDGDP